MQIYQDNIRKYEAEIRELTKVLKRLSILRLVTFLFSIILITILANERLLIPLLIVTPICMLGFGFVVSRHRKINSVKQHTTFLKEINEAEILRLENKLTGFADGETFVNRDHPYVADLDVFGAHSLFQLLNRTTTESGRLKLAEWLSGPVLKAAISKRQEAVKELTPKLDWRQDFQAAGMPFANPGSDYDKLLTWVEKPARLFPRHKRYLFICILLVTLSTLAAFSYFFHLLTEEWYVHLIRLILILVVNFLVLRRLRPIADDILENSQDNTKILGGYRSLITRIESGTFQADKLSRLRSAFSEDGYSAVSEIGRLKRILEVFQLRGIKIKGKHTGSHFFYHVFNLFWLFDVYWIILTEKWKQKNRSHLRDWATAVGEFEVLSSMAGFSYSNPSFTFPEIREEPYRMHFETLGHPLIHKKNRVCNSFDLKGKGAIAMITGSNMAGKSTFLRTVGINMVLAFMGAPCCAASGQVSVMKIFSSMRTQDNLEEGVSSFYAELKRVEQLLTLIKSGQAVFFLLDEMFKGTNSKDRHVGGFSLIKQLSKLNAFGMISTHDLELARLTGNHNIAANFSFNSEIQDGEMLFNYELAHGLCRDFNASELMRRSGIDVLSNIE